MFSNAAACPRFLFPFSLVMFYSASRRFAAVQDLPSERQRLRLLFHLLNLLCPLVVTLSNTTLAVGAP